MMINSKDTAGSTNFDNNNVKYKMNINYKEALNHKLSMIINLKLIHGIHYLKTVLKKKEISRELFILSMEDGSEVYIPKDLSQDHLPISFRYYDHLLACAQEGISDHKK